MTDNHPSTTYMTITRLKELTVKSAPEFIETLPMDMTVSCDEVPEETVLTASDNCQEVDDSGVLFFHMLLELVLIPRNFSFLVGYAVAAMRTHNQTIHGS